MRMETVSNVCRNCSAKIPGEARQGLCPVCLLEAGLGLPEDEDHDAADPTPAPCKDPVRR
jgi:hypothetical protein